MWGIKRELSENYHLSRDSFGTVISQAVDELKNTRLVQQDDQCIIIMQDKKYQRNRAVGLELVKGYGLTLLNQFQNEMQEVVQLAVNILTERINRLPSGQNIEQNDGNITANEAIFGDIGVPHLLSILDPQPAQLPYLMFENNNENELNNVIVTFPEDEEHSDEYVPHIQAYPDESRQSCDILNVVELIKEPLSDSEMSDPHCNTDRELAAKFFRF